MIKRTLAQNYYALTNFIMPSPKQSSNIKDTILVLGMILFDLLANKNKQFEEKAIVNS